MSTVKELKNVMKHFRQALKTKNIKLAKTDTECWDTDLCIAASLDGTVNNNVYTIILFEDRMDVVLDLCVTEKEIFSQETDYSDLDKLSQEIISKLNK